MIQPVIGTNPLELLGEIYIFENPDEIKHFLMANKDLIPIPVKGYERITKIFGNVPLYLELHSDPEEEWEELFIVIKTGYPAEKAFELENKLFKEWFIEVMDKVNGRLNFTGEPLAPESTLNLKSWGQLDGLGDGCPINCLH